MNRLQTMTWQEAQQHITRDNRIIIGFGSTEQHGPLGELGTDFFIAKYFANKLAESTGVLLGPVIPIGMSYHHMGFPGTISIRANTYRLMVIDILKSLYAHGCRRIFIVNGHGGNEKPIANAIKHVQADHHDLKIQSPLCPLFYEIAQEVPFEDRASHAGGLEISLLQAIRPDAKRSMKLIDPATITLGQHGQGTKPGSTPETFRAAFPSGSKGDQRLADPDKGKQFAQKMFDALVAAMKDGWD